jgi:hypothetical protein
MRMKTVTVYVDADACPVKREILDVCRLTGARAVFVASYDHLMPDDLRGADVIQVDRGSQSADLAIANRIGQGDVLVTQDFGLAALALARGAAVLNERGREYRPETIDALLERRHAAAKARRGGGRTRGPAAFTAEDRRAFLQALTKVLRRLQENFSL